MLYFPRFCFKKIVKYRNNLIFGTPSLFHSEYRMEYGSTLKRPKNLMMLSFKRNRRKNRKRLRIGSICISCNSSFLFVLSYRCDNSDVLCIRNRIYGCPELAENGYSKIFLNYLLNFCHIYSFTSPLTDPLCKII